MKTKVDSLVEHMLREGHSISHLEDLRAFASHCKMREELFAYLASLVEISAPYMGEEKWMVYAPKSVGGTANLGFVWECKLDVPFEPRRETLSHALSYTKDPNEQNRIKQASASKVSAMMSWMDELDRKLNSASKPAEVKSVSCSDDQGDPSVEVYFKDDIFDDWWEENSPGYDT